MYCMVQYTLDKEEEMESRDSRHYSRSLRGWAAVAAVALAVAAAGDAIGAGPDAAGGEAITATPASLAALYPPLAKEPVHLFAMLGLQEALSGIVVDLLEGDPTGARAAFAQFQEHYRRAAELVPEWRSAYPEGPVLELQNALRRDDQASQMQAIEAVGGVCHRCHLAAMAPVQLLYRWGSFGAQTVKDPLSGDTLPYGEFKRRLATTFTGITWDLRQGQEENARRQFEAFTARFSALRSSCLACHATPRRSFVDRDVQALLEELGQVLQAAAPDLNAAAGLSARIGQASCSACHLVHVPAAMAQAQGTAAREGRR